ncbi:uncharacterized protein LOC125178142 [Hyalella azteca]|uniref:Uncharacterized protein LOC125178142 n=1 Tax=Hyalella azteca TaxID=294128 RepID=A0A979FLU6_HYAAZ|nr:uncharacterized protein LOC125178142 [Hyalella azteca]
MHCFVRPKCSVASYDIATSVCSMTYEPTSEVTITLAPGVISLFKFVLQEVFITKNLTRYGTLDIQKKICDAERGVPLIINTAQLRRQAQQLVTEHGLQNGPWGWNGLWGIGRRAWLSAYRTHYNGTYNWPDNSPVIGSVFTAGDFVTDVLQLSYSLAAQLAEGGKIVMTPTNTIFSEEYPVLCKRIY